MAKSIMALSAASVLTVATATIAVPVYAQQATPAIDGKSAGDIIVTAQKRSERVKDVPAVLLVQTQQQLEAAGVRSPTDLSIAFPGLTYANSNAVSQPAIRGVTTNATGASVENPVAVYIDGIYQPMQAMTNSYDVSNVSGIEVLKGPQGTLFGRNVVAGAVMISTRNPNLHDTSGRFEVTGSDFGGGSSKSAFNHSETGFITTPIIPGELAASLSGGYYQRGDFVQNIAPSGADAGEFKRISLQGKLLWQPSDRIKILFNARYYHENAAIGGSIRDNVDAVLRTNAAGVRMYPDGVVATQPWTTANDEETRAILQVQSYSLRADFDTDIGTFTSLSAFQHVSSNERTDTDGGYSPLCRAAKTCSQLIYAYKNPQIVTQEVDFSSKKFGEFSFVAGVFAYSKSLIGPVANDAVGFLYQYRGLVRSFAGFVDGTLDLTSRLSLIAGVRYTYDNEYERGTDVITLPDTPKHENSWSAATKRFVIKYRPVDMVNLYASYSEGYQAGFENSRAFYNKTTFALVAPAQPTNPQYLTDYEVGAKFNVHGITLNLSAYRYDYTDMVVQRYNGIATVFQNAAGARITGVDFDGTVPFGGGFSAAGGVSWLPQAIYTDFTNAAVTVPIAGNTATVVTTNLTGTRLLRAPKISASLSLNYQGHIGRDRIEVHGTLYHSDRFHTQLGNYNDSLSYTMINLSASYSPHDGPLTFTVFGRNLTNKAYLNGTVASAVAFVDYWAPPRELGGSIAYNF